MKTAALLEERLHCQDNPADRPSLEAIAKLLGSHALVLEIAAAQIKKPGRLATVLHKLEQDIDKGKLSNLKLAPGDGRDENLERPFALGYEYMTPEEQRRFRALGVFAEESLITTDAAGAIWRVDDVNTAKKSTLRFSRPGDAHRNRGTHYRHHSIPPAQFTPFI